MKRVCWPLSFAMPAALAVGIQVGGVHPATQSGYLWKRDAGQSVEILGVYAIKPDAIECWSPEGTPNRSLETLLADYFNGEDAAATNFVLGAKNRYVVYRTTGQMFVLPTGEGGVPYTDPWIESASGSSIHVASTPVTADKHVEDLLMRLQVWTTQKVNIPFRRGEKTVVDGTRVEIGHFREEELGYLRPGYPQGGLPPNEWVIDVGVGGADMSTLPVGLQPLDPKD